MTDTLDVRPRTAVIGLGAMGLPILLHLGAAGFDAVGWDSDAGSRSTAAAAGATVSTSLEDGLGRSSVALFLVGSEESMNAVLRGQGGAFDVMPPGSTQLVMGTISPELAEDLADAGTQVHQYVLSSPLCRAVRGAQEADSLALVSGDPDVAAAVRPLLSAFCSNIFFVGNRPGDAQVAKAVNNLMLWASVMANEEGFRLAVAYGLDIERLRECLVTSTADSWSLREWAHVAEWPWSIKDLHLVQQLASHLGVGVPVADQLSVSVQRSEVLKHANESRPTAETRRSQ